MGPGQSARGAPDRFPRAARGARAGAGTQALCWTAPKSCGLGGKRSSPVGGSLLAFWSRTSPPLGAAPGRGLGRWGVPGPPLSPGGGLSLVDVGPFKPWKAGRAGAGAPSRLFFWKVDFGKLDLVFYS